MIFTPLIKKIHSIEEKWEIASFPEGHTLIADGSHQGRPLTSLNLTELVGCPIDKFPFLIKRLHTPASLFLQSHPEKGKEAQSKAWYMLNVSPGTSFYTTPDLPLTRGQVKTDLPSYLKKIHIKTGDLISIPSGCIHGVDHECVILEIKQNANLTYFLYEDGIPSPQEIEKSLNHLSLEEPSHATLVECPLITPYFTLTSKKGPCHIRGFEILFFLTGPEKNHPLLVPFGSEHLIAPGVEALSLRLFPL
ncbi:MAG: hypothetical protein KBC64_01875 [Simkaniaceae bacterium]|nr:hypothetical protein [Simkaniaceae bacterium]